MGQVLEWGDWWDKPGLGFGPAPVFHILRDGELHLPIKLNVLAPRDTVGDPAGGDDDPWEQAVLRWSVRRIEAELSAEDLPDGPTNAFHVIESAADDHDVITRMVSEKACAYQHRDERSTYCGAASRNDDTAIGNAGLQLLAPTSQQCCIGCELPADEYICDHLVHPQVTGRNYIGGDWSRSLLSAMCEKGEDAVSDPSMCRPAGNPCWSRAVVRPQLLDNTPLPALALPEAFDFLNAVWQLRYRRRAPLLRLITAADAAGLALPVANRSDFEGRAADLADLINNLRIEDDALPDALPENLRTGTLNRLEASLDQDLSPDASARVVEALRTLRRVVQVRNGFGHSGAAKLLPKAFADLGIPFPPESWSEAWDVVRHRTIAALGVIRSELIRTIP